MPPASVLKLLLVGFAIVVALFVMLDPATWKKSNQDWWRSMSPGRRRLVLAALAATLLQTFL